MALTDMHRAADMGNLQRISLAIPTTSTLYCNTAPTTLETQHTQVDNRIPENSEGQGTIWEGALE
jgi:hypothetical protein